MNAGNLIARSVARNPHVRRAVGAAYSGSEVECPACRATYRSFFSQLNDQCWNCGTLPRHRQIALLLHSRPEMLWPAMSILHVAPEASLRPLLPGDADYVAGDLDPAPGLVRLDVTGLHFAADRFDAVICNHVMEHVPDDRAALRELHRVLRPGGWAILMTPILRDVTDEDAAVVDGAERARRWGQADHVRRYGWDYVRRLEEAGFTVEVVAEHPDASVRRHALNNAQGFVEPLFLATA